MRSVRRKRGSSGSVTCLFRLLWAGDLFSHGLQVNRDIAHGKGAMKGFCNRDGMEEEGRGEKISGLWGLTGTPLPLSPDELQF